MGFRGSLRDFGDGNHQVVRVAGEGTIYRRKDGRWVAALSRATSDGRRHRIARYARSGRDAMAALEELRKLSPAVTSPTVMDAATAWLAHGEKTDRWSTSTLKTYRAVVQGHVQHSLGSCRVEELNVMTIEGYLRDQLQAGLSRSTIILHKAVLGQICQYAIRHGLLSDNPVAASTTPGRATRRARAMSLEEACTLVNAVRGDPLEVLYLLALSLGLRSGEVRALRWHDIDLTAGSLVVQRAPDGAANGTKTPTSFRVLPIPAYALAALRRHTATTERLEGLLYSGPDGSPITAYTLTRRFQRNLRQAGLPKMRFHDLRHTFATFAIASGANLKVVSDILGHSRIATTADIYGHVLPSVQRKTVEAVASLLELPAVTAAVSGQLEAE